MQYAPIAIFAYARLDHLRRTVNSLLTNPEFSGSPLYIYCDGPRHDVDKIRTDAVRAYVDTLTGESVRRIYRDHNLGLAKSIILGVSEVLEIHNTVIVIEDDLFVSPFFLQYMNEGLCRYLNEDRVASIHGYCYPVQETLPEIFFLRGADCWGWATWARAWKNFEPDGRKLLARIRQERLVNVFDMNGAYPYSRMLINQINGKNDSWAVRWHASCFLKNMLTLYPGRSLVNNIGTDDSGTHCSTTDDFTQVVASTAIQMNDISLEENKFAAKSFARFLARHTSMSARATRVLQRFLSKRGWR